MPKFAVPMDASRAARVIAPDVDAWSDASPLGGPDRNNIFCLLGIKIF